MVPLDGFDPTNPFKDIKPSFGPFAGLLGNWFGILLGLVWGIGLVVAAIYLVIGIASLVKARRHHQSDAVEAAEQSLLWPVIGIIGLAAAPLVWTVIWNATSH